MTGKSLSKIIQQLLLRFYIFKKWITCISKHNVNHKKLNHSFNDSKRRRMVLACRKKTVSVIKSNNFKIWRWLLLFELPSLFLNKNRHYSHKTLRENIDFWSVAMRSEVTTILGFNQYLKSDEIPSIIYADLEYFIKRIEQCKNKSEKASTKRNRWTYSLPVFNAYNMDIS